MKTVIKKQTFKRIALSGVYLLAGLVHSNAQNLNNPNVAGPMGLQVNSLTGNLLATRTDLVLPARGLSLEATFYYNSFNYQEPGPYGNGWRLNYQINYTSDANQNKIITWGDGRQDEYLFTGSGYAAPNGYFSTLTEAAPGVLLLTEKDGLKYFFENSSHKQVTRIMEPNGNGILLGYTDTLLTQIATSSGLTLTLSYSSGRLQTITDANANPLRSWHYQYDTGGHLLKVTNPLNFEYRYQYLINGPIKELSDKNANVVNVIYHNNYTVSELIGCNQRLSFFYEPTTLTTVVTNHLQNASNQVTKYHYKKNNNYTWLAAIDGNCCGFKMNFEYDAAGNKVKETDANGNATFYTYDNLGNVVAIRDALNQVTQYTYAPPFNYLSTITDAKGFTTTLTYDSRGNLTQIKEPGNRLFTATYAPNGDIITSTDPKGNVYQYTYDAYGNPATVTGPNGYAAAMTYNSRGQLLSVTDSKSNQTTLEYDILNRLKKLTDPLNSAIAIDYDANDNPVQIISPTGQHMGYSYDASNRWVIATNTDNHSNTRQYDEAGNLVSMQNAMGEQIRYTYDALNRLKTITNNNGETITASHDANGNVTMVNLPNGAAIRYAYDALNRLVSVMDDYGSLNQYTYDANGNITSVTNGAGATTTANYDSLNRLQQVTDPLGNSMRITYDAANRMTSLTDKNGNTTHYTYDGLNRVLTVTDAEGATITLAYDTESNITGITDQNGNTTQYTYDALKRLTRITYANGKYMAYTYNNENLITQARLTDGSYVQYSYDQLNRLTAKTLPDGQVHTYTYDAQGRVLTASNQAGTVSFTYDNLGRISSESFNGRTVSYQYSITGRNATTIYPNGTEVRMNYDTRNRLVSVVENGVELASYAYNSQNQITTRKLANGLQSQYQYDAANRLIGYISGSGHIQQVQITYDKAGNKTAIVRPQNNSRSEYFTYDNNYRLTQDRRGPAGSPNQQHTYTYDAVGNRLTANLNGTLTSYTANHLNQLVQKSTGSTTTTLQYDDHGNLIFDGRFHKKYDADRRLLIDSVSPAEKYSYQYDAMGRRVAKTTNGQQSQFTFAGITPVQTWQNGQLKSSQVFTGFLKPLTININNQQHFYFQNELGSVEAITNDNGQILERYEYEPFGRQQRLDSMGNLLAASLVGNRIGFTAQEYDSATGSNAFFFRNYQPELGVFYQRDLLGYADGMGLYQYVGNNPANGVDILGLRRCPPPQEEPEGAPPPPEWALTSQLTLDMVGNTGLVASMFDVPRQLAEHGLRMAQANAIQNLLSPSGQAFSDLSTAAQNLQRAEQVIPGITKLSNLLGKAGPALGAGDLTLKAYNNNRVMNNPNSTYADIVDAQADVVSSGGNLVGGLAVTGAAMAGSSLAIPGAVAMGSVALLDLGSSLLTGQSLRQHHYNHLERGWNESVYQNWLRTFGLEDNEALRLLYNQGRGEDYLRRIRRQPPRRPNPICPQNGNHGGTRRPSPPGGAAQVARITVLGAIDPNEIIGPTGQPDKRWVSINDRLPYTINFENDTAATAPAKYIRITAPVHSHMDAATLELGSFAFNSLSFEVPAGTSAYYQRLDCRDSLGLYVDLTAGYDVVSNQVFWQLQAIDPITLTPTTEPLAGVLLTQDTTNPTYGHGFVKFTIKPKATTVTLDTITAQAEIVFDQNDALATNIEKNTIDAFAPTSQLAPLPANSPEQIALQWAGQDDAGGSGIHHYSLYASTDGVNFNLIRSQITRTDTIVTGQYGLTYHFFVLATDSVGNTELLRPGAVQSTFVGNVLPTTWLYFNGVNQGNHNLLRWATTHEINVKEYLLERSANAINFKTINRQKPNGTPAANGNYQYLDERVDQLKADALYYRIKQTDNDGSHSYSSVVKIAMPNKAVTPTLVYPNPTQNLLHIATSSEALIGTIALVIDVHGKAIQQVVLSSANQMVNTQNWVPGMYFIKLKNGEVLKVMKQ